MLSMKSLYTSVPWDKIFLKCSFSLAEINDLNIDILNLCKTESFRKPIKSF